MLDISYAPWYYLDHITTIQSSDQQFIWHRLHFLNTDWLIEWYTSPLTSLTIPYHDMALYKNALLLSHFKKSVLLILGFHCIPFSRFQPLLYLYHLSARVAGKPEPILADPGREADTPWAGCQTITWLTQR